MALSKEELAAALEESAKTPGLDMFVGETLVFKGFTSDKGQFGEFFLVDIVDPEGDDLEISTGSKAVLAQLKKMKELDAFPFSATVASYPTQYGNAGYKLEVA